jgi:hypothetical protein
MSLLLLPYGPTILCATVYSPVDCKLLEGRALSKSPRIRGAVRPRAQTTLEVYRVSQRLLLVQGKFSGSLKSASPP